MAGEGERRGRLEGRGSVEVKGICDELRFCDSNQCRSAIWICFGAMFEVGVGCRAETEEPDGKVSMVLSSSAFSASRRMASTERDLQVFSALALRSVAYGSTSVTLPK